MNTPLTRSDLFAQTVRLPANSPEAIAITGEGLDFASDAVIVACAASNLWYSVESDGKIFAVVFNDSREFDNESDAAKFVADGMWADISAE